MHEATKSLPEYWTRSDRFYNFKANVRGLSHVLATVDESTYSGGTMKALADHPVAWCKDFDGGRSFYTNVGASGDFSGADVRRHLAGAIQWTAGKADPVYSDCGATVLANYQQTKISVNPNLNEPIGFDVLPDGRVAADGARPASCACTTPPTAARRSSRRSTSTPTPRTGSTGRRSTTTSPPTSGSTSTTRRKTVVNVKQSNGTTRTITTPPNSSAPLTAASLSAWDDYVGYFQLSRFKFVEDASGPHLDLGTEQKILRVSNNRGACCHVAGDIDFDSHNNLWLVTGDDTPSGGGNSGGFSPHNDMKTDETQTVRLNAAVGTFTLTFDGQTTAAIAENANAAADPDSARRRSPTSRPAT